MSFLVKIFSLGLATVFIWQSLLYPCHSAQQFRLPTVFHGGGFPAVLSMFAVYRLLRPMGLINHRAGLILIYTGTMAVFSLWNIKGYFDTVPVEIEEAARMDGANPLQVVTRIVLPLAKPSIVVTALMVLIYVWNEYIYATTFMTGEENYTLAAGLYALQATEMSGSWPVFAAASITVSIPVLIIFFLCQKHMTSGLTAGGVKG